MLSAALPLGAQPAKNQDRVSIDATVTDSAGRSVPDLTAADFEIQHEGKPLQIAELAYVRPQPPAVSFNIAALPSPLSSSNPDDPRLVVIVDDLTLSPQAANRVNSALLNFIDSPEQARQLVSILRTSWGT